MSEDDTYRSVLLRRIAEAHSPTATTASWNGIKQALLGATDPS